MWQGLINWQGCTWCLKQMLLLNMFLGEKEKSKYGQEL